MPKMFIYARKGVFTAEERSRVAAALTDLGMSCERLADTEEVRAGVWVIFTEHAKDAVFSGGRVAPGPLVALIVYALEGGLNEQTRADFISGATSVIQDNVGSDQGGLPVYVVIQETPEIDWGMYGRQVSLFDLRAADRG